MAATRSPSRPPDRRAPCPKCGPQRHNPSNRTRLVRAEWVNPDGSVSWFCNRCEAKGVEQSDRTLLQRRPAPRRSHHNAVTQQMKAQALWDRSLPINGTPAEVYLSAGRALSGPFPPTLRYLPPYRQYPHAMIAACVQVPETQPDKLQVPRSVYAVHLTELSQDGSSKTDKRMLGPISRHPICLAPPNDNLGLVITEGIEDALSVHQATSLGAWAAGSASHMAKLADVVPDYVECVTLMQDDDPAGARACDVLTRGLLQRGFEVRVVRLGKLPHAA